MEAVHAVVINLDRDADRLAHMAREMAKVSLPFERFPAVKGAELPAWLAPYFPDHQAPLERRALSAGEVGCYASHLAICRRMVDGSLPSPLLVVEDDIEFAPDFAAMLAALVQNLPADWDIIRLSNETKRSVMPIATLTGAYQLVRYSKVPPSTGASLISRAGAEKFLKQTPRTIPVDQDLRRVWAWDLNTYGVAPAPVRRDIFDVSSIDSMTDAGFRVKRWRIARLRRGRMWEALSRHLYGARTFGADRWIMAELINIAAALTPKTRRAAALARWSARLAPTPKP